VRISRQSPLARLLPWALVVALLLVIVVGLRSIWLAQHGELGRDVLEAQRAAGDVRVPVVAPERSAVYACPTPDGDEVFSDTPCPDGRGRTVAVTTVEATLDPKPAR